MERRIFLAMVFIVLISSGVTLLGIINLSNQQPEEEINDEEETYEFEWAVEVGDEFTFQIIVTGSTFDSHNSTSIPPVHVEYNETIIYAEVIHLPMNTTSLDNATLFSEIISPIKFNCTFANSSEIPEPMNSILRGLLSWTIAPLNSCELLNSSFYKNNFLNPVDYANQNICLTKMNDSSLNLTMRKNRNWLHPGMAEIWRGVVNRTTGLPYLLTYSDASFCCWGEGYTVLLTLNRIEG